MNTSSKRGSALLIVLGFLSFMIVSAVAFSVYMRMERVPSSALRRSVVVRQLVKGALAQAISRIDTAMGNDPFPGVVLPGRSMQNSQGDFYNTWVGRVFMPPTTSPGASAEGRSDEEHRLMADTKDTVSVLNLEALGYLPPPLINDVRFNSRRSWAAAWEQLNFDAGRYAFCAVNVSDYFDINKVKAGVSRTSAVENRLSLTSFFTDQNNNLKINDAKVFNQFTKTRGSELSEYPFVSMMDYNLALGSMGMVGQFRSPFVDMAGGQNNGVMYNGFDKNSTWNYASQMFIAGSYNETSNVVAGLDLSLDKNNNLCGQPFKQWLLSSQMEGGRSVMDIYQAMNKDYNSKCNFNLNLLDAVALYDYLDRDDVPTSLALPTVERTPMISGIGFSSAEFPFQLTVEDIPKKPPQIVDNMYQVTYTDFKLTHIFPQAANIGVVVSFPFKWQKEINRSFTLQAFARVFLSPTLYSARSGSLVSAGTSSSLKPTEQDWNNTSTQFDMSKQNAWISLLSNKTTINLSGNSIQGEEDIYELAGSQNGIFHCSFPNMTISGSDDNNPFFRRESWQKGTVNPETGAFSPDSSKPEIKYTLRGLYPINGGLTGPDQAFMKPSTPEADWPKGTVLYPHVAIWVRIMDENGDTVDVVPATLQDDQSLLGVNNMALAEVLTPVSGNSEPWLMMRSPSTFAFEETKIKELATYDKIKWGNGVDEFKSMYVADPRWNWAPENWFYDQDVLSGQKWFTHVTSLLGAGGRDADPFMFVSNQGYLQSMGEFSFLPRTGDFELASTAIGDVGGATLDGVIRSAPGDAAHASFMWKTYRPYNISGNFIDDETKAGRMNGGSDHLHEFDITDGQSKFAVNPYTDSDRILAAALANTPYNWWVAGTNTVSDSGVNPRDAAQKKQMESNPDTALKFAFNEEGGEARMEYRNDLVKIAAFMKERFKKELEADPSKTWEEIYDGWNWSGREAGDLRKEDDPLWAQSSEGTVSQNFYDSLYDVDRKFLYSYWRSCFANNQQLFLVFVRAESSSLGSSGEGQTPGQLGGRAVALVWREPATPANQQEHTQQSWMVNRKPHKTRILFYHQFD
jgi:hypothetical protein